MAQPDDDSSSSSGLVGLVVVSHSRALALAAVSLAAEMVHQRPVRIAVAAGLDEVTLGTDAVRIRAAILEVDSPAGVVVLMDLGSAVLSAELALDLLDDPAVRDRVLLSPAPLVEGLVVAAVAAAGGASRHEVAAEARGALLGKAAHLNSPADAPASGADDPPTSGAEAAPRSAPDTGATADVVGRFTVANLHGLHARPAARLVSELRGFDAQVQLRNLTTGAAPVPASSLSRVATLAALKGHDVEVRAVGAQAREAVDHLLALAARQFDETLDGELGALDGEAAAVSQRAVPQSGASQRTVPQSGASQSTVSGGGASQRTVPQRAGLLPASPGIGIGPVRRLSFAAPPPHRGPAGDPADEWRRVLAAMADVRREIERVRAIAAREVGAQEARIFDAHLLLLSDSEVLSDVKRRVDSGADAITACADGLAVVEKQWSQLPDPYLRARAEDVRAVGAQVLAALTGAPSATITGAGVLVAKELSPAQVADLDRDAVQGIVLAFGSPSSHAAILARSRGIPALVAAGPGVLSLLEGTTVIVDGTAGELIIDPPAATLALFHQRANELAERDREQRAAAGEPAVTRDGTWIEVAANLGSTVDAKEAAAQGADSAGLVRTEFLFLDRERAPDIGEQAAHYLAIAEALSPRRVTLRTLDVGGDKPLTYLPMPAEENPFLGQRGIRLCLDRPELLRDQLLAICQVARQAPTSVMFPMVSTVAEIRAARELLIEAAGPAGLPAGLRVGMMVEVPAAALKIATFLPYLDFISIGTNDLTQYVLAAERGNAAVAALSDALDPGVLELIRHVCHTAQGHVPVAVCGEAAADPIAIAVLLGLGVRELSVSPRAVPSVKARVRGLELERCTSLALAALGVEDAAAVRQLVASSLADDDAVIPDLPSSTAAAQHPAVAAG